VDYRGNWNKSTDGGKTDAIRATRRRWRPLKGAVGLIELAADHATSQRPFFSRDVIAALATPS
jgi:hypothetical protein